MKHVLIAANPNKEKGLEALDLITEYMTSNGVGCDTIILYNREERIDPALLKKSDMVIVLGGDGTLLRVATQSCKYGVPIVGFNAGHLGFLTQAGIDNLSLVLPRLVSGDYKIEKRMLVKGSVYRNGEEIYSKEALNDVVITRGGSLQVLCYEVAVNQKALKQYSADGVIVATPTGSTGYNLSAGGPIVEPGADSLLLTPISPHSFMNRSVVFKSTDEICITVLDSHDVERTVSVEVSFDGYAEMPLYSGDQVKVSKADTYAEFIELNHINFLENLNRKMQEG